MRVYDESLEICLATQMDVYAVFDEYARNVLLGYNAAFKVDRWVDSSLFFLVKTIDIGTMILKLSVFDQNDSQVIDEIYFIDLDVFNDTNVFNEHLSIKCVAVEELFVDIEQLNFAEL